MYENVENVYIRRNFYEPLFDRASTVGSHRDFFFANNIPQAGQKRKRISCITCIMIICFCLLSRNSIQRMNSSQNNAAYQVGSTPSKQK